MKKNVVLLANDRPGLEVCKYLRANGDTICRLYVHEPKAQKYADEIIRESGCALSDIYLAPALKDPAHVAELRALRPDFLITVYWAYLLTPEVIAAAAQSTVNFHPAMLPVNRGWFPHVHSILDGTPTGVTLHAIDSSADTGPIWAQKPVPLRPYDTAYTIYNRLQDEIIALFKGTWPKIAAGEIMPTPQDESRAVYHKKSEIGQLDHLDLNAVMRVGDVINLLRARSFGDRGFAYFDQGGQKVYLNLSLNASNSFQPGSAARAA
jgi:methionyl-tRNA formyltransferase